MDDIEDGHGNKLLTYTDRSVLLTYKMLRVGFCPVNQITALRNYRFIGLTIRDFLNLLNVAHIKSPQVANYHSTHNTLKILDNNPKYIPLLRGLSSINLQCLEVCVTDENTTAAVTSIIKNCCSLRTLIAYLVHSINFWFPPQTIDEFFESLTFSTTLKELHLPTSMLQRSLQILSKNQSLQSVTFVHCNDYYEFEPIEDFQWSELNRIRLENKKSSLWSVSFVNLTEWIDFQFFQGGFKVVSDYEEERDAMESFLKFRICKGIVNGWRKEDPNGNAVDRIALDNIRDDHLEVILVYILGVDGNALKNRLEFGFTDGQYCLWYH